MGQVTATVEGTVKSSCPELQARRASKDLCEVLKPFPPARLHFLSFCKQHHQVGTIQMQGPMGDIFIQTTRKSVLQRCLSDLRCP